MGMITIWWSLKQHHQQRQTSIMSIFYNLPFAAIALIFLMSCSLGKFIFFYHLNENKYIHEYQQNVMTNDIEINYT